MGILSGLIGGFAQGGLELADSTLKAQQRKEDQEYESELLLKRQAALEKLRQDFDRAKERAKLEQDKTNASDVSKGAKKIDTERSAGLINQTVGPVPSEGEFADKTMTADDIATIRNNMKPEDAKKLYGIDPLIREQRAEDSGVAAQGLGLIEMSKDFRADAERYRKQNKDDEQIALGNKREDNAEAHRTKQLDLQISQHKETIAKMGGDSATKKLAKLRLDAMVEENDWRKVIAKLPSGDPKRAAEMQRGMDMGWVKSDQNDVSTTVKTTSGATTDTPVETTVTTKGRAGKETPQSQIDTLFPKRNDGKKEGSKDGGKPVVQRDPNIPQFGTFDKMTVASAAEIADAQRKADDAKQAMDRSRNSQTINAYNQAATQLATIAKRGR